MDPLEGSFRTMTSGDFVTVWLEARKTGWSSGAGVQGLGFRRTCRRNRECR